MKNLFDKTIFYESLLLAYYAENCCELRGLFNENLDIIIGRFLEIFTHEDEQHGTNHILLIPQIYSNACFDDRIDFCKNLGISKSTLQRYREKYCAAIKLIIENFQNGN